MKTIRLPETGEAVRDYMRYLRELISPVVNLMGDNVTTAVERRGGAMCVRGLVDLDGIDRMDWGWVSSSGTVATLHGGFVLGFNGVLNLHPADREVSCGGTADDPHLIVAQGTFDPFEGEILSASVVKSTFSGHSATSWRWPLYTVWIDKGVVVRGRIHHVGSPINLKLVAGP